MPPIIGVRTTLFATANGQRYRTGLKLVARWDLSQTHREQCLAAAVREAAQAAGVAMESAQLIVSCVEDYDELVITVRHLAIPVAGQRSRGTRGHAPAARVLH